MIFRKKKEKEQLTDIIPIIDDDDLYDVDEPEKYKVITMEESKILREEAGVSKTIFGKPTVIIKVSNKKIEKQLKMKKRRKW